jgi:hypothetical protein
VKYIEKFFTWKNSEGRIGLLEPSNHTKDILAKNLGNVGMIAK